MGETAQKGPMEVVDHRQGETMFGYYWSAYGAHSRELLPPGVADVYCDIWTDGVKEGELCVGTDGCLQAFYRCGGVVLWLKKGPDDQVAHIEELQGELRSRGPSSPSQSQLPAGPTGPESPMRNMLRLELVIGHINRLCTEAKTWLRETPCEQLGAPPGWVRLSGSGSRNQGFHR